MDKKKRYYNAQDIMQLYDVGLAKAQKIIREAKWLTGSPDGKLGKGKLLPAELEAWERNVGSKSE